jgi:phosphoglycolate phosphatase
MIDSIIFDLDGTLWDATDAAAEVWKEVALKHPEVTDPITADRLKSLYGQLLEDIAVKLLKSVPRETAIEIMKESTIKQCPYIEQVGGILYPQLVEVLDELKKQYRLFIVSNCEEGYIQCFLNAHKLHDYFEDFEYPGRTRSSKAENIRMIIDRNGLETPVYVGDTQGDANSSKTVGVPFIYAKYGFGNVDEYEFSIDSFAELPEVLKQIDLLGNA